MSSWPSEIRLEVSLALQLAGNIADKTGRRWLCPCEHANVHMNQGYTVSAI